MKWIQFNPEWPESPDQEFDSPNQSVATAAAEPVRDHRSQTKVVVAEDDAHSREIVCALLRKWGFEVLVARDRCEAMEGLRAQNGPVLAILDWTMPGMDGLEVCRRVRETDKLVYILFLTARSGKEQVIEGLQAGADDYLVKPFNKEELQARLKVGLRILMLQTTLAKRVNELEKALKENRNLKLHIPL